MKENSVSNRPILLAENIANSNRNIARAQIVSDFGEELSRRMDTPLNVLYIQTLPKSWLKKNSSPVLREKQREIFESLYKTMRGESSQTDFFIEEGEPIDAILKWRQEDRSSAPRMIIISAGKGAGVKRSFLGKVSENLVQYARVPLLIFGPSVVENSFEMLKNDRIKILLSTDLSRMSRMAEVYAHYIARKTGAHIVLYHSYSERIRDFQKSFEAQKLSKENLSTIYKGMRSESRQLFNKRIDYLKQRGISVEGLFLADEQDFVKALLEEAGDDYDFIMMGTNSHAQETLGGSARKVILKSPIPVMLCRSGSKNK